MEWYTCDYYNLASKFEFIVGNYTLRSSTYLPKEKLKLADLEYNSKAGTDLILGADVFVEIIERRIKKGNPLMVLSGKVSTMREKGFPRWKGTA